MKNPSSPMIHYLLSVLILAIVVSAKPAIADSSAHILGEKPLIAQDITRVEISKEPIPSTGRGRTIIRVIGDKPIPVESPTNEPAATVESNRPPSSTYSIRVIGDKPEPVSEKTVKHPAVIEDTNKIQATKTTEESLTIKALEQRLAQQIAAQKAEEERRAKETAEQERLAKIKADQELEASRQVATQKEQERLAALKLEEARKASEQLERERLAKIKAEQEKAAGEQARQLAIQQEQERRAAIIAEESRKTAEKNEQERIAAQKADEERLAAARKALLEKSQQEIQTTARKGYDYSASKLAPVGSDDLQKEQLPATIWELYLAAKATDPVLGRTEARVAASKAESDVLRSGLLPHVDTSAGVKLVSQTLSHYSPTEDTNDYTAFNYNVSARMTLIHVPTYYSLSAAAANLKVEQAGVAAARQNLIVKFTDSYFALLKAQTDRQIAIGEINRLKQVLDQSQAFLKAGTGDIIAVYEAQSRLDGAGADLTRSESNLRLAEQKLSSIVGKPVRSIVNYFPQLPIGPDPDDLDWWVATMEKEQPVVRQAREGLAVASEQRKSVKAEYLPVLQATGGYDVNRGTVDLPTAEVRQWFVGASVSVPLYSGGETSAKIQRATAFEEERQHAFNETMDQQRENVKQAYFNLRYNISFIRALEQKKASAEIQLAAIKKGRKIGTRNAIDVLNAEQTYSIALRDYTFALYDNVIRVIQLKSAAGILAEADIADLPSAAPTLSSVLRVPPTSVTR